MKIQILIRVVGMILLTVAISLIVLAMVHLLRNSPLMLVMASIGWNG